jgi:hypothetical protein
MPEIKAPSQSDGIPKGGLFSNDTTKDSITAQVENVKPSGNLTWKDYEAYLISRYVKSGMSGASALHFAQGGINAIKAGNHYSRDSAGNMRPTPSDPQALIIRALIERELTTYEKDAYNELAGKYEFGAGMPRAAAEGRAMAEVLHRRNCPMAAGGKDIKHTARLRKSGFDAVLHMAEKHGVRFIPCSLNGRPILKWAAENQKNFSSDIEKLKAWYKQGVRRFSYLPGLSNICGLDIDRNHADGRDGIADFYKVIEKLAGKTKDRMPRYFKNIPESFPCYTETPSGGLHILLKFNGQCKIANLVYEGAKIEIKHLSSMLSLGRKENGVYVFRGDLADAPEMPRFLAELISPPPKQRPSPKANYGEKRVNLEKILDKVLTDSAGHNDRQKKFAWRAAFFGYGIEEVLSFVKSRPDVFGKGADTETVINHSWRSSKQRAMA